MTQTQQAVVYDEVGGPAVLHLSEVAVPTPAEERVLVAMRAVGLNPYDAKARSGLFPRDTPFPRGIGGDVAGVVTEVGSDAHYADGSAIAVGDEVFGWGVNTLRQNLVVRAANIARVPEGLSVEQAGALATPAFAAHALVTALALPATGTILVSAASGAVGSLVAQWGVRAGLHVIGTASEANFERLRAVGVDPVSYRGDLAQSLREALGGEDLAAVYDSTGEETLAAATDAGAHAMVTIAGDEVAERFGAISTTTTVRDIAVLAEIARDIATGAIEYPVAEMFPLTEVVAAFEMLENGHPQGKVVVTNS